MGVSRSLCMNYLVLQCGVIECVPNSKSRDQLGKATQVSLKAYFNSRYGSDDTVQFQEVRLLIVWADVGGCAC